MSLEDAAMGREVLREISKRPVDITGLNVYVSRGVVYLKGHIEKLRGYHESEDLHEELMIILRMLKQRSGVRDVVCEVALGGPSIKERLSPHVKRERY